MTRLVKMIKLHEKTFGVKPKEVGEVTDPDELYHLIKQSIEENRPYDESERLSALDRELVKRRPIQL